MTTFDDSALGRRLRAERERVGLSQDALAAKMGVTRVTQGNYESGKRSPDAVYLSGLAEHGVDMHFVSFGQRATPGELYELGVLRVLPLIAARASIEAGALWEVLNLAAANEANQWSGQPESELITSDSFEALVAALFDRGGRLLGMIAGEVRGRMYALRFTLPTRYHADLLLTMYRTFRAARTVDHSALTASVSVACELRAVPAQGSPISKRTQAIVEEMRSMLSTAAKARRAKAK